ncbi:MAG: PDZ domain-containing protein [Sphingomonas sp.]|nr:PDZ domain-containing protein [Sphingomonas sp.]
MRWTDYIRRSRQGRPTTSSDLGQWIEAALLFFLVVQVARLIWALVTPVGVFGDWRAREPVVVSADARSALFAGFDPFFRTSAVATPGGAPVQQVTSLPLKLFGIRVNEASGLGSAIIANESGVQTSYAVGEEIAPGIKLKSVEFDHVVIERGGATETLYIEQSGDAAGAPVTAPAPGAPPLPGQSAMPGQAPLPGQSLPAKSQATGPLTQDRVLGSIGFAPRTENGRVTGIVVSPQGGGEGFALAGFRPGDIIVQVNGQPVRSAGDIQTLQSSVRPGARMSFMVERGAATVPVSLILPDVR